MMRWAEVKYDASAWFLDGPFADSGVGSQMYVTRLTKCDLTVAK